MSLISTKIENKQIGHIDSSFFQNKWKSRKKG